MKKEILFRKPGGPEVILTMKELDQIVKDKGLHQAGDVQMFHTQNVLRRMKRYMPFRTGTTYKITVAQTDIRKPLVVTDVPYGKYLYHGKVMVDPKTGAAGFMTPEGWRSRKGCVKVRTERPLRYTLTKNPQAGPYWDRTLSACEGKAMAADLQRYLNRR